MKSNSAHSLHPKSFFFRLFPFSKVEPRRLIFQVCFLWGASGNLGLRFSLLCVRVLEGTVTV
jgi:hypothetical protein